MSTKRSLSSSLSSDSDQDIKRTRTELGIFSGISIHFIQTKIKPSELDILYSLAESNGADVQSNVVCADVIVTAISMRRRLERYLNWDLAKQKAVVTPAWITQSVEKQAKLPCREYAAICALEECTAEHCPDHYTGSIALSPPPSSSNNLSYMSRFSVQRASPLVCPNQNLLVQLAVIREARALEGEGRSALSYSRSIAAIKAYPFRITSPERVSHLPFVGTKILAMIHEFTSSGRISEADLLLNSIRYRSLVEFTRIHGIGPHTARKLYDTGCRTLEDVDRRFGAESGHIEAAGMTGSEATTGIRAMLELRDDLSSTISRNEVEEVVRILTRELEDIEPGCMQTICGGYRRGKLECNDVDFVFTHPLDGKDRGLCKKLVERLQKKGLVTHVLHLSSFRSSNPLHIPASDSNAGRSHWDTLDKSLVVFRLPAGVCSGSQRIHCRVDLICAPIKTYWTAVVGWTGSTMFERDLRLWAKQNMGLKFDSSGIIRRRDTRSYYPASERAVFEVLGLEWIDPTLRNADL